MILKRVALLTDGIWPYVIGGMQKHSYYLCKYLAKEKMQVVVFHPQTNGYTPHKQREIFTEEELSNLEWVGVPNPSRYYFPGHFLYESYRYSKNLNMFLEQQFDQFDLLYIQGFSGWYTLLHNIDIKYSPVVLNFRGFEMFQKAASFKNQLEFLLFRPLVKRLLQKADYVQPLGKGITNLLFNVGVEKQKILEIGIGIEKSWVSLESSPSYKGRRVFTFIGRYERRKGIHELNIVLEKLLTLYDFELHFVGPISKKKRLNQIKSFIMV